MKKQLLLLCVATLLAAINAIACSCSYQGPFVQMAPKCPLVAMVKVTRFLTFKDISGTPTPMSMEVEITEIIKGKNDRKKIIVWGDPGNLCRPYLSVFKEDGYYAIAFISAGKVGEEKQTDYAISDCGAYWLTANKENATVTGDIDSKEQSASTMSISNLKLKLAGLL
jgi:hypothetical protein